MYIYHTLGKEAKIMILILFANCISSLNITTYNFMDHDMLVLLLDLT